MSRTQTDAAALGLAPGASADEVRATAQQLLDHLATAPEGLSGWAAGQRRLAERAIAGADALAGNPEAAALAAEFDALGIDEDDAPVTAPKTAAGAAPAVAAPARQRNLKWLAPVGLVVAGAAVVLGVFFLGGPKQTATDTSAQASSSAVAISTPKPADPAMVKALEAKIKANPKDTTSMAALGEIYNEAAEYDKAASWQQRITQVEPKNVDAWLALGVAQFNGGNLTGAEKSWTTASKLSPKRAEIFYNLGFLYYSMGDQAKASASWQKVVDLDPTSSLAQTVKSHIQATSPSATPTASASR